MKPEHEKLIREAVVALNKAQRRKQRVENRMLARPQDTPLTGNLLTEMTVASVDLEVCQARFKSLVENVKQAELRGEEDEGPTDF